MRINVKIPPFKLHVPQTVPENIREMLMQLGLAAKKVVERRIAIGETISGEPMLTGGGAFGSTARYTDAYEKWKSGGVKARIKKRSDRKTRLSPKGKSKMRALYTPGDRFNLSGAMKRAWDVIEVGKNYVRVGFMNTKEALKAWGNHILRPTFALNFEEQRAIVKEVLAMFGLVPRE